MARCLLFPFQFSPFAGRFRRFIAGLTAVSFLFATILAPVAESNFWTERRRSAPQNSAVTTFARLSERAIENPHHNLIAHSQPQLASAPLTRISAVHDLPRFLINLPAGIADLRTLHRGSKDQWVVLIQDMHDVASAQAGVARILKALGNEKNHSLLVGIEGASGAFDLGGFRNLRERELRGPIADYLLGSTFINGAEHFGLTAEGVPNLWGVETPDLYQANVQAYRAGVKNKDALARRTDLIRKRLTGLSAQHFNSQLNRIHRQTEDYYSQRISLASYLKALWRNSAKDNTFTHVAIFVQAAEMEGGLDFTAIEKERDDLIRLLADRLDRAGLDRLLDLSLAYRLGQVSFKDYFSRLKESAHAAGISIAGSPAFRDYADYALLSERIDGRALFAELTGFERSVRERHTRSLREKEILVLWDDLHLLEKLSSNALGFREWEEYASRKSDISLLESRLAKLTGIKEASDTEMRILVKSFESFYESAELRSESLVKNLLDRVDEAGKSSKSETPDAPAILIAGGFHTQDLERQLRKRGLSYVTLAPRAEPAEGSGTEYLDVFSSKDHPLESIVLGDKLFLAPPSALAKKNLLATRQGESVRTLYSILYATLAQEKYKDRPAAESEIFADLEKQLGAKLSFRPGPNRGPAARIWDVRKKSEKGTEEYRLLVAPQSKGTEAAFQQAVRTAGKGLPLPHLQGEVGDHRFALFRLPGGLAQRIYRRATRTAFSRFLAVNLVLNLTLQGLAFGFTGGFAGPAVLSSLVPLIVLGVWTTFTLLWTVRKFSDIQRSMPVAISKGLQDTMRAALLYKFIPGRIAKRYGPPNDALSQELVQKYHEYRRRIENGEDVREDALRLHNQLAEQEPVIKDRSWTTEFYESADGTSLAADVRRGDPNKETVFLLHGWGSGTVYDWQKVPGFLEGHTIVMPHRRGYLPSGGQGLSGNWLETYGKDLADTVNRWGRNGAIVAGQSMGSMQIQHFLANSEDANVRDAKEKIRGIIFVTPSVSGVVRDMLPAPFGAILAAVFRRLGKATRPLILWSLKRLPHFGLPVSWQSYLRWADFQLAGSSETMAEHDFKQSWRAWPEHMYEEFAEQQYASDESLRDAVQFLTSREIPTFLIVGEKDSMIPRRATDRLAKMLQLDQKPSRVRTLSGGGYLADHMIMASDPIGFMESIESFVADATVRSESVLPSVAAELALPSTQPSKLGGYTDTRRTLSQRGQPISTHGIVQAIKGARIAAKAGKYFYVISAVLFGALVFGAPSSLGLAAIPLAVIGFAARRWRTKALPRFEMISERAGPAFLKRGDISPPLSASDSRSMLQTGAFTMPDGQELRLDEERARVLNDFQTRTGYAVRLMTTSQLKKRFGKNRLMEIAKFEKTLYVNVGMVRAPPALPVTAEGYVTRADESEAFNTIFVSAESHLHPLALQVDPSQGFVARQLARFIPPDRVNYFLHSYNAAILYLISPFQKVVRPELATRGTELDIAPPSFPQDVDEILKTIRPILEENWLKDIPENETPTALVTGANGFAAPWMIRILTEYNRLVRDGTLEGREGERLREIKVVGTDIAPEWHPRLKELFPEVTYVGDASFDDPVTYEKLSNAYPDVKYHMLFDFGGLVGKIESPDPRPRDLAYQANVSGKKKLFDWAVRQGSIAIYHVSTAAVYRPENRVITENDAQEANATYEDYGLSKWLGETVLWETYQNSRREGSDLRHLAVFRPGSLTGEYLQTGNINRGLAEALKIVNDGFFVGLPKTDPLSTNIDLRDAATAMMAIALAPRNIPAEAPDYSSMNDYAFNLAETPFSVRRALLAVVRQFPLQKILGMKRPGAAKLFGLGGPLNPSLSANAVIGAVKAASAVDRLLKLLTLQPLWAGLPIYRIRQAFDMSAFSPAKLRQTIVQAMKERGHEVETMALPPFDRTVPEGAALMKKIDDMGWAGFPEGARGALSPLQESLREKIVHFRRARAWVDALHTYRRSGGRVLRRDLKAFIPKQALEKFSVGPLDAKTLDLLVRYRLYRMSAVEKLRLNFDSYRSLIFFSLHRVFESDVPLGARFTRFFGWMRVTFAPLLRRENQELVWIFQSMNWMKRNAGLVGEVLNRFPTEKPYFRLIQTPGGYIGAEIVRGSEDKPRIVFHRDALEKLLPEPDLPLTEAVDRVARHFNYPERGGVVLGVSAERFAKDVRAENPLRGLIFGSQNDVVSANGMTVRADQRRAQRDPGFGWYLFYGEDSQKPVFGIDLTGASPRWMKPDEFEPVLKVIGSGLFIHSEMEDGRFARILARVGVGLRPMSELPEIFARVVDDTGDRIGAKKSVPALSVLNQLAERESPLRTIEGPRGQKTAYRITGNADGARTVVLLHDWRGKGDDWAAQRAALAAQYQVVTIDLPGHGGSPLGSTTPRSYFADAAESIARILEKEGLREKITLVGQGLGGKAALQLHEDLSDSNPEMFDSLVLFGVNVAYDGKNLFGRPEGPSRSRLAIMRLLSHPSAATLSKLIFGDRWEKWSNGMSARALITPRQADITADFTDTLAKVRAPLFWVEAANDRSHPPFQADAILRRLHNVRAAYLEDLDHEAPRERPHLFNVLLQAHLSQLDAGVLIPRDVPGFNREIVPLSNLHSDRAGNVAGKMNAVMEKMLPHRARWESGSLRRHIQGTWLKNFAHALATEYGIRLSAEFVGALPPKERPFDFLRSWRRTFIRSAIFLAGASVGVFVGAAGVAQGNAFLIFAGAALSAGFALLLLYLSRRLIWEAAEAWKTIAPKRVVPAEPEETTHWTGDLSDDLGGRLATAGVRYKMLIPPARRLLKSLDPDMRRLADRFDSNLSYLAATAVLTSEWPDTTELGVEPEEFRRFHNLLEKSTIKLLGNHETEAHHARLLQSLHRRFRRIQFQYHEDAKSAQEEFGKNAAHIAVLLGGMAEKNTAYSNAVRPWIFRDLLALRDLLSAEEARPKHSRALSHILDLARKNLADGIGGDGHSPSWQVADVFGPAFEMPGYLNAVAKLAAPAELGSPDKNITVLLTDDVARLKETLSAKPGVRERLGKTVHVIPIRAVPPDALRRNGLGQVEWIDLAKVPKAVKGLESALSRGRYKTRILTQQPEIWWLGGLPENRREALVEFILWITRDMSLILTPGKIEEYLRAKRVLDIQA